MSAIKGVQLAGKTGTAQSGTLDESGKELNHAWFVGFDPDITIGVWVGFDTKRPIGQGQSGAVAALPIWIDVMQHWIDRRRKAGDPVPEFPAPGNIVFATTERGEKEAFIAGTEPGAEIR